MFRRDEASPWHPSYFLAALGAGGMSVAFFLYLMWMVPHQGYPMPTWDHWTAAWSADIASGVPMPVIISVALAGVLIFGVAHIALLIWNIREYKAAKLSGVVTSILNSPAEIQMLALPLRLQQLVKRLQ